MDPVSARIIAWALFAAAWTCARPAIAAEPCADPEALIADSIEKLRDLDLVEAERLVRLAETCTNDPAMLAKIQRQRGLLFDARHDTVSAFRAFARALELDPEIGITAGPASAIAKFDCAKRLGSGALDDQAIARSLRTAATSTSSFLCPERASDIAAAPPPEATTPRPDPSEPDSAHRDQWFAQPGWPAWTLFGIGLVSAGASVGFAISAKAKDNDSLAFCMPQDPTLCRMEGVSLRDTARLQGNVSTVFAILALLSALAGLVLWAVPSEPEL